MVSTVEDRCACGAHLFIDMPKNPNLAAEQHTRWLMQHATCRTAYAVTQDAEARRTLAEDPPDQAEDSHR